MKSGWLKKPLSAICNLQNGYAFKSGDYIESSNTLNIRMSSIRPDGNFDPEHNQRFLPDYYVEEYASFLLNKGDLIIAMTDMAGDPKILGVPTLVSNLNGRNFLMNQRVGKLFGFSDKVSVPFLRYFLTSPSIKEFYKSKGAGGLQINISKGDILSAQIPLPSITEQDRIVAILDEAFDGITIAKANAEKNLQNARALFESHLKAVFNQRGEGWVEKTIKEITSLLGDGLHGTPKYTDDGEYYFVNGNNLNDGKIVFKESTKKVSVTEYEKHKKKLTDRTVLVSINGTLGNVAFYNNEKIILGKSACYFNLLDNVDKHFIKYIISSPYFLQYAHREATGATIKNVSLKSMREFKVPLPSLTEQNTIVRKLDRLSEETQRLEAIYRQKLAALDELKKSLLHQAFTGKL
jgi:type I restriction enzyme S subunit